MAKNNKEKTNFPETQVLDKVADVTLTPAEYFEKVKNKIKEEKLDNIKQIYDVTMTKLKKFMITGQAPAAKELYAQCLYLKKEQELLNKGICKYVLRDDIDKYIDDIADDCVCVIEMKNFDRDIPDDIVDIVANTMDIFDEFYVVFTDYTGEKRSKVAKEKRDKDPILFGNIFVNGKVSQKMYFIGDWIDEYCDLTLDKMIEKLASKNRKNKKEIIHDISDLSSLEEIEKALFGSSTKYNRLKS